MECVPSLSTEKGPVYSFVSPLSILYSILLDPEASSFAARLTFVSDVM